MEVYCIKFFWINVALFPFYFKIGRSGTCNCFELKLPLLFSSQVASIL